jgi:hypothetical protein
LWLAYKGDDSPKVALERLIDEAYLTSIFGPA